MMPVPKSALEMEFEVHLNFLRKSINEFDAGDYTEFRRLASTLRVLLHRTNICTPAVDHIDLDDSGYVSYAHPLNDKNLMTECSLAIMRMSFNETKFLPALEMLNNNPKKLTLDEWKNEFVLRDDRREVFTRWELAMIVANKQGLHIDQEVEAKYHRLVNENSIGWIHSGPEGKNPILDLEKVYIRHIAWECLISLEAKWKRLLGNRGCHCGSGKKARYCCMKPEKVDRSFWAGSSVQI